MNKLSCDSSGSIKQYKFIDAELPNLGNFAIFPLAQCKDMERMGVRKL